MHIAYVDESGDVAGATTSHFVLVAVAIPAGSWKEKDRRIRDIKIRRGLGDREIHTAWMARRYPEQERILNFGALSDPERREAVASERKIDLAKAALGGQQGVKSLARNYSKTKEYVHLTYSERMGLLRAVADEVGGWNDCRMFGDAQKKSAHIGDPERMRDFAFEQVVTRFNMFLDGQPGGPGALGMIVHDQNETASGRLTERMRNFHREGTAFSEIPHIVETPLFVDSKLTSMVQVADLIAYSLRRFLEKDEQDLFNRVYPRFERVKGALVGLRHYTGPNACDCRVCIDHQRAA